MSDDRPEADRAGDAPHPRETPRLLGQGRAEAAFLDAWNTGRLHHGWLLTGPRGVGKATFAWRAARFLLCDPPARADTLDAPEGHPALPRIRALSEPRLLLLRRAWDEKGKRLRRELTVDEVRRLDPFLGLSADGRRVVIVDDADAMNRSAANAILKLLEEPPARTTFLMVSHQPARLLPTIRSRCRTLRFGPLPDDALAEAVAQAGGAADPAAMALAEGSVGAALGLAEGAQETYAALVALFARAPMDRAAARRLADAHGGKGGADRLRPTLDALQRLMHRAARAGLLGPPPEAAPGEAATLARLAPHDVAARALAALAQGLSDRAAHAAAVNVDPAAIVWDQLAALDGHARGV